MTETCFAIPGDIDSPTGGYGYDRRLLTMLPSFGVNVRHLELPGTYPAPSQGDLAATVDTLNSAPPNSTLLIDGLAYGAMPFSVIEKINRRIIALVHHPLALETGLSERRRAELEASERAALALADKVVVTSPATQRILEADYGVAKDRVTVALPGTDPALRATGTGTPLQLLCVGTVTPRKAYDVLIEALLPLKHLDWRVNIAGALDRDRETVAALNAQIAAAKLEDRVSLPGVVVPATLDRFYESTDLFVMPSRFEGYGMALAEAMARGLPIICSTGGAAAETVPDGAALKVPPGDVAALTKALESALTDKRLRVRLADASWEHGRSLPTWNETARRVAAAILDIPT
ncbi:Glycosyltransferase involved in cell wall bisynthesis [Filomicrobium insigne]|uniref:Glycosyltransferase involved in cell wall bisynthesis n=1 Tax=Filomicrobium insigne TaxID=418854 RepID=A0A1H0GIP4_9HYPH|nr:glycosyltransferase family 4 protein [Filomicrobium insigne]SDO06748.1 Glycosyltransferase involved in cell wall bisynthesis [Filomicrobium insigne]